MTVSLERRHDVTPLETRFWSKVDKLDPSGCWLWTRPTGGNGYAVFYVSAVPQKAHRVSWQLVRGAIPDGLYVCHRCDVRHCVNPDHLFLGTASDNMADMVSKRRHSAHQDGFDPNWHLRPGKRHPMAKLTPSAVREIRRLYHTGEMTVREIIPRFNVSRATIYLVISRKAWAGVPDGPFLKEERAA